MNQMRELLPAITEEDRQLLHYNPNTDDLVEWAQEYAIKAVQVAQFAAGPVPVAPDCYDAGLLSDFGGGNVEWWQDYIRAELARAHEFYASQHAPEAVPIVSKTVGYLAGGTLMRRKIQGYDCKPLIIQPTASISGAEIERLQRCETALVYARSVLPADKWADDTRLIIDAAIAGEREG